MRYYSPLHIAWFISLIALLFKTNWASNIMFILFTLAFVIANEEKLDTK